MQPSHLGAEAVMKPAMIRLSAIDFYCQLYANSITFVHSVT